MPDTRDFAILVPSFNSTGTVDATLRSIQQQSGGLNRIAQVVLSDDASADDTVNVARACWTSDVPLRIRRQGRRTGECGNVNGAFAELPETVRWVLILHSDDMARPEWLRVMLRAADGASSNVASITASWDVLLPDGRLVPGEQRDPTESALVHGNQEWIQRWVIEGCWWKITSCCIRRDVFLATGGLDSSFRQMYDVEFILRVLRAGYDVLYVPASLSIYRVHDRSVTANSFRRNWDLIDNFLIFCEFMTYLDKAHKQRGYYLQARNAAHRVLDSVKRRQFRRAASAVRLGANIGGSYLRYLLPRA
ncbi:MAG: glycosyltransferase family 2 protein [Chloroflexi bacterium]|nr:glycosyltransferase family 2 protein [Chloroflexota bacterium]MBV9543707.1 glycosyltransferase family 2 protein [Chloroflexota bacterium]